MKKPEFHQRKNTRLKYYNYSKPRAYFITICTHQRKCYLSDIKEGKIFLSPIGEIVEYTWLELVKRFPNIKLDECVIMPNHFHGIIILLEQIENPITLGEIVRVFKAVSKRRVALADSNSNFMWQRNYYERVIRDESDLTSIREYINNNVYHWLEDDYHPNKR